ncbi:MAG: DUF885 domain-containing protein [Gammaproteobacteria bacterium]|nr:DUF885 domain-containing protein [Gammaproteobacteria bacterium]
MQLHPGLRRFAFIAALAIMITAQAGASPEAAGAGGYQDLVALFTEWRAFEQPPDRDGAPDYTAATFAQRYQQLKTYQQRLAAFDPASWTVEQQIDYQIVRAEMNGMDFYIRVLQPWARDPAFYTTVWTEQSDTPAHEGPTHHHLAELWTYEYPLSPAAEAKLAAELSIIPALLGQAEVNLTGNARDLWVTGTGSMQKQVEALDALAQKTTGSGKPLRRAIHAAREATVRFVGWLQQQAPSKDGPSGVGKENYSWSLQHVHLIPMTWDEEVAVLKRELARAHAALKLEEERNRALPPMPVIATPEEYELRANEAVTKLIAFLADRDLFPMRDYMDPALRAQMGEFVPIETRNFFAIATHYEPLTLYTHFYHWWDLAQMRDDPHESPVRRGALLYNIWDSRAEGMATAMEEFMLHAGLYDDAPRAREIVWIMLAQRAARGLASLYAHANMIDIQQAKAFQVKWTPRGWMRPDLDLLGFEQQLYLRQPGYGSSYVTGKYMLERLMKDYSDKLGAEFTLKRYFGDVNRAGMIPVSLIRWQLTGQDDEIRTLNQAR